MSNKLVDEPCRQGKKMPTRLMKLRFHQGDILTRKNKKRAKAISKKAVKSKKSSISVSKKKKRNKPELKKALKAKLKTEKTVIKLEKGKKGHTEIEKEIVKLYDEKEKLEMERLTGVLSQAHSRQFLVDLAGENTLNIMKSFYGSLSDEEIAKKLKIKISDVRATLNKLHNEGLVSYIRDKDSETGWFSYSWSLNRAKVEEWVGDKLKSAGVHIDIENGQYYFCPSCGVESVVKFENASESNFRCGKCEKSLEFIDKLERLDDLPLRRR